MARNTASRCDMQRHSAWTTLHALPPQIKNSVGEDVRENVFVSADEEYELTGSRGTAHFTVKWEKDSKKEACTQKWLQLVQK